MSSHNLNENSKDAFKDLVRKLEQAEKSFPFFEENQENGKLSQINEMADLLREVRQELLTKEREVAETLKIAKACTWVWDIQSDWIRWSGDIGTIFGEGADESGTSYQDFLDRIHPDDRLSVIEQMDRANKDKGTFEYTHRIVRPDGSERKILSRGTAIGETEGMPIRMVGASQDITEHTRMQDTLRTMDTLLRVAGHRTPVIMSLIDKTGMIRLSIGKRLISLHGSDSSAGHSIYELYEDTPQIINNFERALSGETFMDVINIKGITFETYYEPYYDEGEVKGVVGIGLDVSEHLRIEQTLRESEVRQRLLLNSIRDYAIYTLDVNGFITSWNTGARSIKGYSSDEILNQHFSIFYQQDDRESGLPEKALEIAQNTGHFEGEGWRLRKDGTRYWASVAITPLLDADGSLRGYSKIVRDITQRKQMEEALRESEARFRTIFEGAAKGIELIDMQGRLLMFNPAICRIFGYEASELRQEALLKDDHAVNLLANLWQFKEIHAGTRESFNLEKPFQHKDGHWVWGRLSASLVRDTEGKPLYAVAIIEDINERRQMEVELAELQRRLMEGREEERLHLAQELHDGPVQELYGISFSLNAFSESLPEDYDAQALEDLQHTVHQVVQRLRSMSSDLRPPTLAPFGLEKAIRSHAQQFQEDHPEITIRLDLMPDQQSLPERARLALFRIYQASLANVLRHAEANQIVVRFTQDAEEVVLEIEDDGKGFRVPTRWITLARQGHLGLVGAMERAESIGGKFEVRSEPGNGTRVRVAVSLAELSKLSSDK